MCGIAGFFRTSATPGAFARLGKQVDALSHRGPDGRGLFHAKPGHIHLERDTLDSQGIRSRVPPPKAIFEASQSGMELGLGMRRLAIVDVKGGHGPHFSEHGDVVVVLNGEIYNHKALAQNLRQRGYHFQTACDTEVIAHLYLELGMEGVLAQIEGMYGLALFDSKSETLYLARDPLGIKSLYFAKQPIHTGGEQLWFASELQGILVDQTFRRTLDARAIAQLMMAENIPAPNAILKGVEKLLPGRYLAINVEGESLRLRQRTHYQLPQRSADKPTDCPKATDIAGWQSYIEKALEAAVLRRVPDEVGVAAMLSGGIDSGLVTALLAKSFPQTLETFSVAFEDARFDESPRAKIIAQHLDIRHNTVLLEENALKDYVELLGAHMAEPLGDHSLVPSWLLAKTISGAGLPVALSGDGGDELFAGYPTYLAKRLDPLWDRIPPSLLHLLLKRLAGISKSGGNFSWDIRAQLLLEGALERPAWRRQARWMSAMGQGQALSLLDDKVRAQLDLDKGDILGEVQRWDNLHKRRPALDRSQIQDIRFYMQDGVLVKVDRASMASALEVRVPFLDPKVVAAALAMPWQLRIVKNQTKWMLRQIAQKHLPNTIVNGPKKGFGMPTSSWLRRLGRPTLMDWLQCPQGGAQIFEQKQLESALDAHLEQRADNRRLLWTAISLRNWQRSPWAAGF